MLTREVDVREKQCMCSGWIGERVHEVVITEVPHYRHVARIDHMAKVRFNGSRNGNLVALQARAAQEEVSGAMR